jgi:hypothetical protein
LDMPSWVTEHTSSQRRQPVHFSKSTFRIFSMVFLLLKLT